MQDDTKDPKAGPLYAALPPQAADRSGCDGAVGRILGFCTPPGLPLLPVRLLAKISVIMMRTIYTWHGQCLENYHLHNI